MSAMISNGFALAIAAMLPVVFLPQPAGAQLKGGVRVDQAPALPADEFSSTSPCLKIDTRTEKCQITPTRIGPDGNVCAPLNPQWRLIARQGNTCYWAEGSAQRTNPAPGLPPNLPSRMQPAPPSPGPRAPSMPPQTSGMHPVGATWPCMGCAPDLCYKQNEAITVCRRPAAGPAPDPFLAGVRDGTKSCAQALENITNAALAFARGDFVSAQKLLGIDRADIATQMLTAITTDLTMPVATAPLTPYAQGYRMSRRLCTYATLWRPRGPSAKGTTPQATPQASAPQSWAKGLESGGADAWAGQYQVDPFSGERFPIMGRSRTPRSQATSTNANKGESLGYHEARFGQGEIGLQAPGGANVAGTDFITAARSPQTGLMEIIVTDVKTSAKSNFPQPKTTMPGSWQTEVYDAVGRIQLSDTALEAEIVDAALSNRIRLRQLNVDLAPGTQGATGQPVNITGW